jgi:hypothetical protein
MNPRAIKQQMGEHNIKPCTDLHKSKAVGDLVLVNNLWTK